jgi:hypothetical protein
MEISVSDEVGKYYMEEVVDQSMSGQSKLPKFDWLWADCT